MSLQRAFRSSSASADGLSLLTSEHVAAAEQKGHKRGRIIGGLRLFEKAKHVTLSGAR